MRKTTVLLLVASVLLFSCAKKDIDTSPVVCTYDPNAAIAPDSQVTTLRNYLDSVGLLSTAIKHPSGLYYQVITPGADITPSPCLAVYVNYKGTLKNNFVFDSTATGTPIVINLLNVIAGWRTGIPLIKKGGKIRLYIPPIFGYKDTDVKNPATNQVVIPANSILIFDVEVVDAQ